jgi:hypothetical protein
VPGRWRPARELALAVLGQRVEPDAVDVARQPLHLVAPSDDLRLSPVAPAVARARGV